MNEVNVTKLFVCNPERVKFISKHETSKPLAKINPMNALTASFHKVYTITLDFSQEVYLKRIEHAGCN